MILYRTYDKNLKKIISESLSFDDAVKYGLAIAQGAGKVEQTRGSRTGQAKDKSGKEYLVEHVLIQNMNKRNVPVKKLFVFHEKKHGISKVY